MAEFCGRLELFTRLQARGVITAETAVDCGDFDGTQYAQAIERIRKEAEERETTDLPIE